MENKLWWVYCEEWESGEAYTTRTRTTLVYANSPERAIDVVLTDDPPDRTSESHWKPDTVKPFVFPEEEGIVK